MPRYRRIHCGCIWKVTYLIMAILDANFISAEGDAESPAQGQSVFLFTSIFILQC